MKRRAVFLDRDGVLNRPVVREGKPHPPDSVEQLEILPGVADALLRLRAAGFRLVVVTNQPDVARGRQSRDVVERINTLLCGSLPLDEVRTCYHDDGDGCGCRKPKAGLLLDAAREHRIDLSASFMVGDRWRDIDAGQQAGCRTVLIDYQYREALRAQPDARANSLSEAADWILAFEGTSTSP